MISMAAAISLLGMGFTVQAQDKPFNTVFKDIKSGAFTGTANGVAFVTNAGGSPLILDFQGSVARLVLEQDSDEVYDVSTKIYTCRTTSGKTQLEYRTYNMANELLLHLTDDTYQAGLIDGASDKCMDGLSWYYKSEKGTEYLVLQVEKPLLLSNFWAIRKRYNYNLAKIEASGEKEKIIKLLPHSVLVLAIQR